MPELKKVPYHGNPGNACALACYAMAGQYLLPDQNITFEEFGEMADWRPGYVVWAFPIWKWMMDHGICIEDYDISDMEAWAKEGTDGLRKSLPAEEFEWYEQNTFDLDGLSKEVAPVFNHPNFSYRQCSVTWDMILKAVKKPGICDVTLDGRKLHREEGFSVHRVVIIDITDKEVIFHDPVKTNDGAYKHEPIEHFRAALDGLSGPELTHYSLKTES
jgi:hypothetical protein